VERVTDVVNCPGVWRSCVNSPITDLLTNGERNDVKRYSRTVTPEEISSNYLS